MGRNRVLTDDELDRVETLLNRAKAIRNTVATLNEEWRRVLDEAKEILDAN